jgi:hypothetical protein
MGEGTSNPYQKQHATTKALILEALGTTNCVAHLTGSTEGGVNESRMDFYGSNTAGRDRLQSINATRLRGQISIGDNGGTTVYPYFMVRLRRKARETCTITQSDYTTASGGNGGVVAATFNASGVGTAFEIKAAGNGYSPGDYATFGSSGATQFRVRLIVQGGRMVGGTIEQAGSAGSDNGLYDTMLVEMAASTISWRAGTDNWASLGLPAYRFTGAYAVTFFPGSGTVKITSGVGTPRGQLRPWSTASMSARTAAPGRGSTGRIPGAATLAGWRCCNYP